MEVFHYCAEVLKTKPLFESCSNEELFRLKRNEERTGAAYNDYDGLADTLLADSNFETDSSDDDETASDTETDEMVFTPEDLDMYYLGVDDANPKRWHKDHSLFTTDEKQLDPVVRKLLRLSEEDWSKLPINREDLHR